MCKNFLLFYNKNLLFLFYIINLQKHPHQIIYNTPSFIKIIHFHIFLLLFPLLIHGHTTLPHFSKTLSLFLFLLLLSTCFSLLLLLSSSMFFFFNIFFLSSSSFSFPKKNSFSFSPSLSLSNQCSLQI